MAMVDRRAGPTFFYIVSDPYSRVPASKIGITQRLEKRLLHIYSNTRRRGMLPDGMAVFSLYSMPSWQQAAELESALFRSFHGHKTDRRTLGWLALKPGMILPVAVARTVPLIAGEQVVAQGTIGAMDDRAALQLTQITSRKEK